MLGTQMYVRYIKKRFKVLFTSITYPLKSGALGFSTLRFWSFSVFALRISGFSVLVSIAVFGFERFL